MSKLKEILNPRNPATRRTLITGAAFIAGFVVLAIISIQGWEYSNSVNFCATTCHDVHPEEPAAFQDSYHARVKCTECHMGRVSTLEAVVLKSSHFRHLPAVLFDNYERPTESETMRPANESCERCHWPPSFHGDTVREITHFQPDENNTEKQTFLILKTGGGEREKGLGYGIHWHIENKVEYIATDEHKQHISWIRTTLPDGRVVEYNDILNPLSEGEIDEEEIRVMDCVDCHNRVGHPFPYPEQLIDDALADGELSQDLPFAKYYMTNLLTADHPDQESALDAIESVREQYVAEYPQAASAFADEIGQAAEVADELIPRVIFEEAGVTWESFPDNGKHKEFAGCFRCHDGKHVSEDGESIRLHCNICHAIPVTVEGGSRPPQMPVATVQEPESHLAANFMADHRFQASEECVQCHGVVEFGTDDSSFCANSACHGQAWPSVELDAAFPHPIELEGNHADAWCHDCHEGVAKPVYVCSNCHEPPSATHFGETCKDCHTPAGFSPANMSDFEHPFALIGNHADLGCTECHAGGTTELVYECSACHQPPSQPHFGTTCEDCHTPEGFDAADMSGFEHPFALIGNHADLGCAECHASGTDGLVYDCAACHQAPEGHFAAGCGSCHTPEGFEESAESLMDEAPEIPHGLDGMDQCLLCHGPDGAGTTIPDGHETFTQDQCLLCHEKEL